MKVFVVESVVHDNRGKQGVARFWTPSKLRAVEEAEKAPGRTWREATPEEVPPAVLEAIRKAQALTC